MKTVEKYELSPEDKQKTRDFARKYTFWVREYKIVCHTMKSQKLTHVKTKTKEINRPTESLALKKAVLSKKIDLVESCAREADIILYDFVLRGVTGKPHAVTFEKLRLSGMPCSRNTYYDRRRRFYWLLCQKLDAGYIKLAENQ